MLADQALADGKQNICIMALQDAYGEGLANVVDQVFTEAGGNVTDTIIYDPKAASFGPRSASARPPTRMASC